MLTKQEMKAFVAGLFQRPSNKWEAYCRAWDRFNLVVPQTILWVVALLTNNTLFLLGLYLLGLAVVAYLYMNAKDA